MLISVFMHMSSEFEFDHMDKTLTIITEMYEGVSKSVRNHPKVKEPELISLNI